jgi:hypothetical protein
MQDKLVDLLGFSDIEFVMELVAHQDDIVITITDEVISYND